MPKKFYIHPSIYLVKRILFSLAYITIAICWIIPSLLQEPFIIYRSQLLRFSIYMSITIILALYFSRLIFYTLKETHFILDKDRIIKRNPAKTNIILLGDVTAFRYIRTPFGFGFGVIKTPSKTMRLSFLIKNLSELIQSLQELFERENKHSVFRVNEISEFKHQALVADFNLQQTFRIVNPLMYIILSFMALSTITAFLLWKLPFLFAIFWIIFSFLCPCIGFLIAHFLITKKISSQLKHNINLVPAEDTSRIYCYTALITTIVYLLCGILYKNIWLYFWW